MFGSDCFCYSVIAESNQIPVFLSRNQLFCIILKGFFRENFGTFLTRWTRVFLLAGIAHILVNSVQIFTIIEAGCKIKSCFNLNIKTHLHFCGARSRAVALLLPRGGNGAREIPYSPIPSYRLGRRMRHSSAFAHTNWNKERCSGSREGIIPSNQYSLNHIFILHPVLGFPTQEKHSARQGKFSRVHQDVFLEVMRMNYPWSAFSLHWLQREPEYLKLGDANLVWGELLKVTGGSGKPGLNA